MPLSPGTVLGSFTIADVLGIGGMGEVYRARDSRLNRDVALKVLPDRVATDPDRLARLRREASLLASLNHPNIAAIYGLEESGGAPVLVLELVPGSTLAERIAKGPMPIVEAVTVALQIIEALDAAHQQGIIHRDLKPANIKLTPEGRVKVLDFGLAKTRADGVPETDLLNTPTVMATVPGMLLGTAPYMSPEQARGQEADRTADVWAFGCVLYEMLTGRRAFDGDTTGDVLGAVLKLEPDWQLLPRATPAGVRRLLNRCLRKDRRMRLRDIGDARLDLDEGDSGAEPGTGSTPRRSPRAERLAWAAAVAVAVVGGALITVWVGGQTPVGPAVHLEIGAPPTRNPWVAISPDGLKVVYTARADGRNGLWVRAIDSPQAQWLAGTEGAAAPFWSPDSRSVAYFVNSQLRRVELEGGTSLIHAAPVLLGLGAAWSQDGTILFAANPARPLFHVPAAGGEAVPATRFVAPQQRVHMSPHWLPDQRHFLYFVDGTPDARGVYVGRLGDPEGRRLFASDVPAVYAARHVVFVRDGQLLAQPFDAERLALSGDPLTLDISVTAGTALSSSTNGTIVYRSPPADSGQRHFVWMDRSGSELDRVEYADRVSQGPALSADGRRIAVFREINGNIDIWAYDIARRTWDRITAESHDDIFPLWSPDGTRIVFASNRASGLMNLFWKRLQDPVGSEEALLGTPGIKFPMDWSRDGKFLVYNTLHPQRGTDVWALPLEGDRQPFAVVQTEFNEQHAQFSPDGHWLAYQSDRTGRHEVYVRLFPEPGEEIRVSTDGGAQVRWHPSGRELFYIAPDDRLMAVPMKFGADGRPAEPGAPVALFMTNVGSTALNTNRQQYLVSADGESFVMNAAPDLGASPIRVIMNWQPR